MKLKQLLALVLLVSLVALLPAVSLAEDTIVWKYAHMNAPENLSGRYAQYLSDRIFEESNGALKIEIYPSSQLGTMQEQAEMVSTGVVQMHHNTWGTLSVLFNDLEVLDTPYLTTSVEDHIKLNDINNSPLMIEFNKQLIEKAGVRILGCVFGGSRSLTCNKPIYSPADLKGVKIRAIPSQVYITAVEGMGAIPIAIDWAEVPTALATGVAEGQENPPVTFYSAKLYEYQKYWMDTRHIKAMGPFVVNEAAFQALSPELQQIVLDVSAETVEKFNALGIQEEQEYLDKILATGMTFIGVEQGLKLDEFKASVDALVAVNYAKYAEYYKQINEYLGY
ncbi:MAG: TRAP transporter substrate-binding protein [Firmicutes bacterium]|nr:TRAP transporter substrate-binding protein [Bacillota bacterium]